MPAGMKKNLRLPARKKRHAEHGAEQKTAHDDDAQECLTLNEPPFFTFRMKYFRDVYAEFVYDAGHLTGLDE